MSVDWLLVVYVIVLAIANTVTAQWLYHKRVKRREKHFLRHLRIEFPESTVILSAMESSDLEALDKLKEQLDALS